MLALSLSFLAGGAGRGQAMRDERDVQPTPYLLHRVKDRETEVGLATLSGRDTADHLGAVLDSLLAVEGALLAREALADDLGVLVDEHASRGAHRATRHDAANDRGIEQATEHCGEDGGTTETPSPTNESAT